MIINKIISSRTGLTFKNKKWHLLFWSGEPVSEWSHFVLDICIMCLARCVCQIRIVLQSTY